jgi:hypothetical protein
MYRANSDGKRLVMLRGDIDNVLDALWATNASGAVVISGKESWLSSDNTEILWAPADGTKPLVVLPINGDTLRWGK